MQIRSFLSYIYYKVLEKDIYTELDKKQKYPINDDFSLPVNSKENDFDELNHYIERFKERFKEVFTKEQYEKMIYALSTLKIEEHTKKYDGELFLSLGSYDSINNAITIMNYKDLNIDLNKEEILVHELLHMSSNNYSIDGERTGFDLSGILGVKLNEGYTEYLTRKYFTRGYKYTESNDNNIIFAKGIENIIGSDKMESYYFNSDINSLIKDLSEYISREDVIKLLYLIDRVPDNFYKSKDFDYVLKKISEINKIKLDKDLEKGIITESEYDEQYAIKVREYRMYQMWSEDTKVVGDDTAFVLSDHEYTSNLYTRGYVKKNKEKSKKIL